MDDLTLLRELGDDLDRTATAPSPRTRHRVVTGLTDEPRRRWPRARFAVPAGAAVLAGGVAVALALGTGGTVPGTGGTVPGAGDGAAPEARSILLAAAETALADPAAAPDPKAFVYTRTKEIGVSAGQEAMAGRAAGTPGYRRFTSTREAWLSVDGSRDGAVTPSGSTELVAIAAGEMPPAYQAGLPTTAGAMRDHLYRGAAGPGNAHGPDYVAFQAGMALAQESLMPPAVRAALFEAMARIPDVEVVRDAESVTGARAVAVAYRERDHRDELLFDPRSHRVVGTRNVYLGREDGLSPGTVLYSSGVLETGVVGRLRLRPDGTVRDGAIQGNTKELPKQKQAATP